MPSTAEIAASCGSENLILRFFLAEPRHGTAFKLGRDVRVGIKPKMEMLPMQAGDVYATYASIDKLHKAVGYEPTTTIREGIPVFAEWYRTRLGVTPGQCGIRALRHPVTQTARNMQFFPHGFADLW